MTTILRPAGARTRASATVAVVLFGAAAAAATAAVADGDPGALLLPLALGAAAAVAAIAALARPALGAAIVVALTIALPREVLFDPGVPFVVGEIKVTDVLVGAALLGWLVHRELNPDRRALPPTAVTVILLLFLAVAALSVMTARTQGTSLQISFLELRPLLSYLLIFPIVADVRTRRDLGRGVVGVLSLAAGASLVTIGRWANGQGSVADFTDGVVRITDDAFFAPMVAVIWAAALIPFATNPSRRRWALALGAVGLVGLIFTFQRGAWLAAVAAVLAILVLLPGWRRLALLGRIAAIVLVGVALVAGVGAITPREGGSPLSATIDRAASLGVADEDVSAQHRLAEWHRSREVIAERPLQGIGVGSEITYFSPLFNEQTQRQGGVVSAFYIHNSYTWLALKLGLVGLALFVALVVIVMIGAARRLRAPEAPWMRPYLIAGLASILAIAVLALSGPHFTQDTSAPYVAAVLGMLLVLPGLRSDDA